MLESAPRRLLFQLDYLNDEAHVAFRSRKFARARHYMSYAATRLSNRLSTGMDTANPRTRTFSSSKDKENVMNTSPVPT